MSEQLVLIHDIRHSKNVKLSFSTTTCCVDREEDWECDQASHAAHDHTQLEEAQEEVAIESVVIEDPCIGDGIEFGDPAKERIGQSRRSLIWLQAAHEGPWSIAMASWVRSVSRVCNGQLTCERRSGETQEKARCKQGTQGTLELVSRAVAKLKSSRLERSQRLDHSSDSIRG